ncbi:GDPmannose 4,6-dehydratase [Algoriphagus faecimaris]|uniref:GDP-mannose 4,6-dehydratase n=1 Tax=Algoriphagus faecimaris TaxID=686796 RepID=A0A1G6UDM4_9BACT|nr:GDP-mannose 4,6-dehydratase [Algoriphagus faecimaris]SDD38776.1 GDPmannose 4,6-dehydratase [Algoriphagus faecimaris]
MKKALITGITGQDGAYLAQLLLSKGYNVIGVTRQTDSFAFHRLAYLGIDKKIEIAYFDLTDPKAVLACLEQYHPDEIYNLAAQSSVGQSFHIPQETFSFNTMSVMNLLDGVRQFDRKIRFYQASSSEMFGNVSFQNLPIRESLLFHPVSPYGISKASAHWLTVNYREAYGIFTTCGILFNHESALRGENFVIKKLINTALKIQAGKAETLTLGNLAVSRDWGYAPKYVEAMWKMLQQERPGDYIICSGNLSTLQELLLKVFDQLGLDMGKHLRLDQAFMRSLDLGVIYGDNTKAKAELEWEYNLSTDDLIAQLIADEREWMAWGDKNKEV